MIFVNKEISYASENSSLFEKILTTTKSEVVEYGLKFSLKAENNGEALVKQILNNLDIYKSIDNEIRSEKSYYIEFKSEEVSGYLEYIYEESNKRINVEITKSGHNLELEELEHRLKKSVGSNNTFNLYRYIKAKTEIADANENVNAIIKVLINNKAKNINIIDLGDSISMTAMTGEYEKIKSGDTWIDFNSAICSYESGTYLIIGTPIIMKSY